MHISKVSLNNYRNFANASFNFEKGRYKNVSEVVRAGLRLLEEEENKLVVLKQAIQEGIDSGISYDFDPKAHLESLKAQRKNNG